MAVHENSLKNLAKGKNTQFSGDIAAISGKKGAAKRRERKEFREYLKAALEVEVENAKGEKATLKEISMIKIAQGCAKGDIKSIELALKVLGEITEKAEIKHEFANKMTLEEWKSFIKDARGE